MRYLNFSNNEKDKENNNTSKLRKINEIFEMIVNNFKNSYIKHMCGRKLNEV
jgi:hypothetical protein